MREYPEVVLEAAARLIYSQQQSGAEFKVPYAALAPEMKTGLLAAARTVLDAGSDEFNVDG